MVGARGSSVRQGIGARRRRAGAQRAFQIVVFRSELMGRTEFSLESAGARGAARMRTKMMQGAWRPGVKRGFVDHDHGPRRPFVAECVGAPCLGWFGRES